MPKHGKQAARLEVFPVATDDFYKDPDPEVQHEVRLLAGNGANLMHSRQGYSTRSNAIRAARAINQAVSNGRLRIDVVDLAGELDRTIEGEPE